MTVPTKAGSFAADLRQSCANIMQADDGHFPQIAGIREYVDSRTLFKGISREFASGVCNKGRNHALA
jgi:hypothetical protein